MNNKFFLLFCRCIIIYVICEGAVSSRADTVLTNEANLIQDYFQARPITLSLKGSSSVSCQFQFDVLVSYPAYPDLPRTVLRVVADQNQAAILVQDTNALPYCLMENGLVVACDPRHPGGLAYFIGNTVNWCFAKKNKDSNIFYSWGATATNWPPEVDLDLRSILQDIPLERVKVTYDKQKRALQITSSNAFLSVIVSQDANKQSFGADQITFVGGGAAFSISDVQVGAPLALRALFGLSKENIEQIGLPLRELKANEFTNILTIPKNFPASEQEAIAAKKLQSFLIERVAAQATNTPPQVTAPDFQTTLARAERGNMKARANLGIMYIKGEGVEQDYVEAAKWLRMAAEQGDAQSQYDLGSLYDKGLGLPQSYQEAIHWYLKAADNKYPEAALNLGVKYFHGEGVAQNYTNALKWIRRAADAGLAVACDYVGVFYAKGYGVATNPSEAITWYRKAAEQGYAQAQFHLGMMYFNGWGITTNQAEGVKWYRLAADQGHALAERNLGICYLLGQGVVKDSAEAYKWLTLAIRNGDSSADAVRSQLSKSISSENIYQGMRRADAFVPHPKAFPDEPQ